MTLPDSCRLLEWDSAFFGFPVARIDPELRARDALESALAALGARSFRLAYWQPPADESLRATARALGGTLAGTLARFERALAPGAEAPARAGFVLERCGAPTRELEELALAAGARSRFAVDPRMPAGTAARMYAIWIRESFGGAMGDEVLAARDAAGAAGLATLKRDGTEGTIGLVAVAARLRGAGVGQLLMEAAAARFAQLGAVRAVVVTQGENLAACRLYESCGFAQAGVRLAVHFWLPAGERARST